MNAEKHLVAVLGLALVALSSSTLAEEESGRRLPRLLVPTVPSDAVWHVQSRDGSESPVPAASEAPELRWSNGERLKGALNGMDALYVLWKSPLFTEEMRVRRGAIRRLEFPGAITVSEEAFRLALVDGSHLTGALAGIDAQTLSFNSAAFGTMVVKRDQVVAIERLRGEGMVKAGPAELLAGSAAAKGRFEKLPPFMATGGRPVLLEFNGGVSQAIDIPERCFVEMRLRIEAEPAFSLTLASENQWVALETWSDELVLTSQRERFVSAGTASAGNDGILHLRFGWDRKAGRCVRFGADGKPLAELEVDKLTPDSAAADFPASFSALGAFLGPVVDHFMRDPKVRSRARLAGRLKGLSLINRGSGFVVERYSVSEWSGDSPPALLGENVACVETASESIAGEPVAQNGDTVTVRTSDDTTREVALSAIRAIRWPRTVNSERDPALTDIWFSDGNLLRGALVGVAEGKATVDTAFAGGPVAVTMERCHSIQLPDPDKATITNNAEGLEKLDVIAAGGLSLHGTVKPTGKPLPDFQPTGCDDALTPVSAESLTFTRSLPSDRDYERAPALLHMKTNESLPAAVLSLDGDRIGFAWSAAGQGEVPTSEVHAVQFTVPSPAVQNNGFHGAGWQLLGRWSAKPETGKPIVLLGDTGIGHPYLLHGDDFSFTLGKDAQITTVRVRLFCQGTESTSDSMNFLLAHYGSQIYCGLERGREGELESNRGIEIESENAPTLIEFHFSGDEVELLVNHVSAVTSFIKGKTGKKTGAGLVIETATMWGNRIGPAKLSDFSMRSSLNLVSPPPFSVDAKREALALPRTRREVPPRQILIGKNGDLLRGEMGAMAGGNLLFRIGLEHLKVPMNRIAATVWVEQPDKTMEDNVKKKAAEAEAVAQPAPEAAPQQPQPNAVASAAETVLPADAPQWLDLTNGGRLQLKVGTWTDQGVAGAHPTLGQCLIPTDLVYRLALKAPAPVGALAALSGWKFENTIDPNPPGLEEADVSPLVGKPAIDFTLAMLDGQEFSLSKAKGKVIVLDFWATWCGPCVRSLPALIETMSTFPSDKVVFLSVNQGESKEQVLRFLQTRGLDLPVAFDAEMAVGSKFGAEAIPYTVVVDPTGNVTYVSMGESRDGDKKIAAAVTKALTM